MRLIDIFMLLSIGAMTAASVVWTLFIIALKHRSQIAESKEERIAAEERMWSLVHHGLWIGFPWLAIMLIVGFLFG